MRKPRPVSFCCHRQERHHRTGTRFDRDGIPNNIPADARLGGEMVCCRKPPPMATHAGRRKHKTLTCVNHAALLYLCTIKGTGLYGDDYGTQAHLGLVLF